MKVLNLTFFSLPFVTAFIITYFTYTSLWTAWFDFLLWTSVTLGFFQFITTFIQTKGALNYSLPYAIKVSKFKVAAFVTAYNENPEIVKKTLLSVKAALGNRGTVFLLDDSTKPEIIRELSEFCKSNGIVYFHRTERRGFKAGAINDAIKALGDEYDLVAIFDADQRPTKNFFDIVMPFFEDPRVAFVQVPQYYEKTKSLIGQGARYQQEPFLRRIMRGRDLRSAFSLGSGTVYRISALKEVGMLEENTVTEDVATSVKIHEKGYISKYVDLPLIWYGTPPTEVSAYITQQSRWALGGFQLIGTLLNSDLDFRTFMDYVSGVFYWLEVGPFTLVQIAAPITFMFGIYFLKLSPMIYVSAYVPYFVFSLYYFYYLMRGTEYGLKGFILHQALEYIEFIGVTASFFAWVLKRKVPFKVTAKGRSARSMRPLIYHVIILTLLVASMVKGILLIRGASPLQLWSIGINLFWASWHYFFLITGVYISIASMSEEEKSYLSFLS
jgi:cellulose synthase (UDP-forming)